MKYLPRASAFGKLESLVEGARLAALSQTGPALTPAAGGRRRPPLAARPAGVRTAARRT